MSRTSIVALSRRAAFLVLVGVFTGCPQMPPNADGGQGDGGCSEGQVGLRMHGRYDVHDRRVRGWELRRLRAWFHGVCVPHELHL